MNRLQLSLLVFPLLVACNSASREAKDSEEDQSIRPLLSGSPATAAASVGATSTTSATVGAQIHRGWSSNLCSHPGCNDQQRIGQDCSGPRNCADPTPRRDAGSDLNTCATNRDEGGTNGNSQAPDNGATDRNTETADSRSSSTHYYSAHRHTRPPAAVRPELRWRVYPDREL